MIPKSYIYALSDPRTNQIRYIGQSVNPNRRLKQHIKSSGGKVGKWINELKELLLVPSVIILGRFNEDVISKKEKLFISKYPNLLNSRTDPSNISVSSKSGYVVECIETKEIFQSCSHAGRAYRCSGSSIKNRCVDGRPAYPSKKTFRKVYL